MLESREPVISKKKCISAFLPIKLQVSRESFKLMEKTNCKSLLCSFFFFLLLLLVLLLRLLERSEVYLGIATQVFPF